MIQKYSFSSFFPQSFSGEFYFITSSIEWTEFNMLFFIECILYRLKVTQQDFVISVVKLCMFFSCFRYLHLPLFCSERAWAYGMQLKSEANTEPRKKYHMISRLKKAVMYAEELFTLCEHDKCDARTKLESQVWESGQLMIVLQIVLSNFWPIFHDGKHKI